MKIVCLLGSPRNNGNSIAIAKHFCTIAESHGAHIQTFALNELQYRGCQGCLRCKGQLDRCWLEDGLTPALDAVREADVLLMASPIYYGDVTSQLKAFIDRTYSYLVPDYTTNPIPCRLTPGKKLVFILVQGDVKEKPYDGVFPKYEFFFQWYGFQESHLIRACGVHERGDVENRKDVMQLAQEIAEKVCRAQS